MEQGPAQSGRCHPCTSGSGLCNLYAWGTGEDNSHVVHGRTTGLGTGEDNRLGVHGRTIGLGYRGGQQSWDTGEDNRHGDREGSRHGVQ